MVDTGNVIITLRMFPLLLGLATGALVSGGAAAAGDRDDIPESPYTNAPGPEKTRDPWLWPYASDSPWNTPVGSNAEWSGEDDLATRDIRAQDPRWPETGIHAGEWSIPIYLARDHD